MEKQGLLKRIPFQGREEMKARVDPVMANYAEEIGVAEIYEQINAM
jgi:TRAP-type transport system periplasmic protein